MREADGEYAASNASRWADTPGKVIMAHPDFLLLEEMFANHRQAAFVTCDETCFCWDVEKWLTLEAAQQSVQRTGGTDRLCENCHEPMAAHVGTARICPNGKWNNWGRTPANR